jgi:hypothetical protein
VVPPVRGGTVIPQQQALEPAIVRLPHRRVGADENMAMRRLRRDIDERIEPFCLHADDFGENYFASPYEVEREGIEV